MSVASDRVIESMQVDAFQRLKVSLPVTLFDNMNEYGDNTVFWEKSVVGAGSAAAVANNCAVRLSTGGTTNADGAIRQTKQYLRYQPGRSLNVDMTFVMGAPVVNARARIGYFDANNGIFLERNQLSVSIVRRTFVTGVVVDNAVAQANWNQDRLDGTGPSGKILNLTKTQILSIQFQYLGVGRIQVGFVIDGIIVFAHQFLNTGNLSTVYMSTGCLPIRQEVFNTGTASGTLTLDVFCVSVTAGGLGLEKLTYARSTGTTTFNTNTTLIPLISIRAATILGGVGSGGTITNRGHIHPKSFTTMVASGNHEYHLLVNPTLTTPSWVANGALSIADYDITASALAGGTDVDIGFVASGAARVTFTEPIDLTYPIVYSGLNSTQDIFTLAIRTVSATGVASGEISWQEEF